MGSWTHEGLLLTLLGETSARQAFGVIDVGVFFSFEICQVWCVSENLLFAKLKAKMSWTRTGSNAYFEMKIYVLASTVTKSAHYLFSILALAL